MENKEDILQSQQQQNPPTKKPKLKKKKGGAKLVLMKSKSHKVVPSFLDHLPPGPATYCKIDSLVKPTFNRVYSEPPTTFEDFQIRGFGTETQKSNKPRWNATATTGKPKPMVSRVDSSLFVFILTLSFFFFLSSLSFIFSSGIIVETLKEIYFTLLLLLHFSTKSTRNINKLLSHVLLNRLNILFIPSIIRQERTNLLLIHTKPYRRW
jgi:hypothetical protein